MIPFRIDESPDNLSYFKNVAHSPRLIPVYLEEGRLEVGTVVATSPHSTNEKNADRKIHRVVRGLFTNKLGS